MPEVYPSSGAIDCRRMSGHCIVCGLGDVGYRIVELLHRLGETVVVITDEVREERLQTAEAFGVRVIVGDARNDRLLLEAGLESAQALIAATNEDLANIEIALDARRMRPDLPVVLRLFDQRLAHQLETSLEVHRALGTSALAAPSFTAAALGDAVLAGFTFGSVPYVVGRQPVNRSPLSGCATVEHVAKRFRLLTLARERPGETLAPLPSSEELLLPSDRLAILSRKRDWDALFSPPSAPEKRPVLERISGLFRRGAAIWLEEPLALRIVFLALCAIIPLTVLLLHVYFDLTLTDAFFLTIATLHGEITGNDTGPGIKLYEILLMILGSITLATVYSMLTDYLVESRLRKLLGGPPMPKGGHVVVVGIGHVGFRVVEELVALGVPVVAVDADPDGFFLSTVRAQAPLVSGDARLDDTLLRAGLPHARAVVAATGDDSVNLGIGLAARRVNPDIRTVVRLFDEEFARKVEQALGVDAALGSSRIAAPTFVAAALFSNVAKAFVLKDQLFVLQGRKAGPEWAGHTPASLSGVHILLRNGEIAGDSPLAAEEELIVGLWRKLAPTWSEQVGR
ncbi:MAG TPA: NAD(P)-binding protein [Thermoanaerobaculia bacterium]|nr:NAD(P)-binding protein [Thermoanaerobaculia bacterium]